MRSFFRTVRFVITDTFRSRGGAVEQTERREFYRDASDMRGRGLSGADAAKIREHTEGGLRPDGDR